MVYDAAIGKAMAIHASVELPINVVFAFIEAKIDNLMLANTLLKSLLLHTDVGTIIKNILTTSSSLVFVSFKHYHREANWLVHYLAKGNSSPPSQVWMEEVPGSIMPFLQIDACNSFVSH